MPEQAYKRCMRCETTKPIERFSVDATMKDGRRNQCKECAAAKSLEWKLANPEQAAAAVSRWKKANPDAAKRSRERHPQRSRARRAVKNAVHRGTLKKPGCCEDCGRPFGKRQLHGHHEDYGESLKVDWLCRGCHAARHRTGGPHA